MKKLLDEIVYHWLMIWDRITKGPRVQQRGEATYIRYRGTRAYSTIDLGPPDNRTTRDSGIIDIAGPDDSLHPSGTRLFGRLLRHD